MSDAIWSFSSLVLAQRGESTTEGTPGGTTTPGQPGGGGPTRAPGMDLTFVLIFGMIVMIFVMGMGGRKERKKRAEMMKSLAKYDKVQMVGGEIGTVVELNDHDIVVRVDEASNTRIRFVRTAVQQVLKKDKEGPEAPSVEVKADKAERSVAGRA